MGLQGQVEQGKYTSTSPACKRALRGRLYRSHANAELWITANVHCADCCRPTAAIVSTPGPSKAVLVGRMTLGLFARFCALVERTSRAFYRGRGVHVCVVVDRSQCAAIGNSNSLCLRTTAAQHHLAAPAAIVSATSLLRVSSPRQSSSVCQAVIRSYTCVLCRQQ